MCKLKADGKALAVGVCNFSVRMIRELCRESDVAPAVVQIEWHPLLQRWDVLHHCREHGIVVQGYGNGGGGWRLWRNHPELELLSRPAVMAAADPPEDPPTIKSGNFGFAVCGVDAPKPRGRLAATHMGLSISWWPWRR